MKEIEVDFTEQIKQLQAEKEAGYPPNCNEGYEAKDGKCVKIVEDNAKKKGNPSKKKEDKKGEEKEGGKNLLPWLKKKK